MSLVAQSDIQYSIHSFSADLDQRRVHVEGHIICWGTRAVVAVAAVTVTGMDHRVLCHRWQSHFITGTPLTCGWGISGGSGYRVSVHAIEELVVACRAGGQRQGDTPNAIAIIIRQRMHFFKAVGAVGAISSNCTLTVILLTFTVIVIRGETGWSSPGLKATVGASDCRKQWATKPNTIWPHLGSGLNLWYSILNFAEPNRK